MTDSTKVRIEQSGPVGPSGFNYRDTKDRLRSNFHEGDKEKSKVGRDSLLVMLRKFRRKEQEGETRFFSLYRTRCIHVYVDALRLPGTVCGFFPVAGDVIDQEKDHADGSRVFTTVVRPVIFSFAHVEECLYVKRTGGQVLPIRDRVVEYTLLRNKERRGGVEYIRG